MALDPTPCELGLRYDYSLMGAPGDPYSDDLVAHGNNGVRWVISFPTNDYSYIDFISALETATDVQHAGWPAVDMDNDYFIEWTIRCDESWSANTGMFLFFGTPVLRRYGLLAYYSWNNQRFQLTYANALAAPAGVIFTQNNSFGNWYKLRYQRSGNSLNIYVNSVLRHAEAYNNAQHALIVTKKPYIQFTGADNGGVDTLLFMRDVYIVSTTQTHACLGTSSSGSGGGVSSGESGSFSGMGSSYHNSRSLSYLRSILEKKGVIMATKCYPISDVWLTTQDENAPEYCDIEEIRNDPATRVQQPDTFLRQPTNYPHSAYLTWVLANDPNVLQRMDGTPASREEHILAAQFIDTGIRVSDTDRGNDIIGILKESNNIVKGEYFGGISHGEIYKRIYRQGTEVEKLWFLGV